MIRIFKTEDGAIHQIDEAEAGCWIALTNPTATEILEIAERYEIDPDHVRAQVIETIPYQKMLDRRQESND